MTDTGASLPGTVNPNGADATYTVRVRADAVVRSITTPDDAGLGSSPVSVSASVTGLSSNTTYYYRLVASNSAGATFGTVRSFRTTGTAQAPAAGTGPASAVTSTGAALAGQVNPQGSQTAYAFEYGTSTAFGSLTPVVALDDADGLEAVGATLSGLAAGTTYFYRVVASNAAGTTFGGWWRSRPPTARSRRWRRPAPRPP